MANQRLANPALPMRRWQAASTPPFPGNHPIFLLRPPYETGSVRAALPDPSAAARVPGTVVGVQVLRADVDPGSLRLLVRDLSQRTPGCPVVVLLRMSSDDGLRVAARLAPYEFRALVPQGPWVASILREALTDAAALPRGVLEWLRLRSIRLNPNLADLIERLLTAAPQHADVNCLLDACRIPQATARWRLRKRGLPPPSRWFHLARAVHAALRLQAQPDASTSVIARQFGFGDHSALAHLLRRTFGVQAREIRGTLGWEWLLDRWFTANRAYTHTPSGGVGASIPVPPGLLDSTSR